MKVWRPAGLYLLILSELVVVAQNEGEYGEKDHPQTQKPKEPDLLPACVLSCTAHTYRRLLERRDRQTVRFHPAITGETGEDCWTTQIKSGLGERLQNAYIVLPVDMASVLEASLQLQPTFPHKYDKLNAHKGLTAVSENCGLRFDVTKPFTTSMTWPKFCTKIMTLQNSLVDELKCPPFLVTVWLREQHLSP
ncbi:hypothetical protein GJAV_G00041600 [Gymnothorax javanicus]|nr:hypothetical protein GJAV_G00041600 [Gymnothorax javanicus]